MMVDATASILSMKKREGFQLLWVAIGEFTTKNKGVFFALDHWFLFDELKRNSQFEWIFHSDVRHHQNATWFEFFGICVRREWPYESGIHNVKIALHASRGSSVGRSHQKICIAYQAIRRELIILETNGRFIACSQGSSWMKASKRLASGASEKDEPMGFATKKPSRATVGGSEFPRANHPGSYWTPSKYRDIYIYEYLPYQLV